MSIVRLYDPVGLLAKEKELKRLREQIRELFNREEELRDERAIRTRPKPRRRQRKAAQC